LAETRGPLNQRVHRLSMAEIQFNEVDLPTFPRSDPPQEDVSPVTEYFQIISEWGNNWHSHTLDQLDFPNDPEQFTKIAMFDFKFDDVEMAPGTKVRRVTLKAPASRFRYRFPGNAPTTMTPRPGTQGTPLLGRPPSAGTAP